MPRVPPTDANSAGPVQLLWDYGDDKYGSIVRCRTETDVEELVWRGLAVRVPDGVPNPIAEIRACEPVDLIPRFLPGGADWWPDVCRRVFIEDPLIRSLTECSVETINLPHNQLITLTDLKADRIREYLEQGLELATERSPSITRFGHIFDGRPLGRKGELARARWYQLAMSTVELLASGRLVATTAFGADPFHNTAPINPQKWRDPEAAFDFKTGHLGPRPLATAAITTFRVVHVECRTEERDTSSHSLGDLVARRLYLLPNGAFVPHGSKRNFARQLLSDDEFRGSRLETLEREISRTLNPRTGDADLRARLFGE